MIYQIFHLEDPKKIYFLKWDPWKWFPVLHCICKKIRIRILKAFISFSKYELTEIPKYFGINFSLLTRKERERIWNKKNEWMQYFHFLKNIACFRFCHFGCVCSAILHLYRISQICNFEIDYWNALKTDKNWKFHSLI